MGENTGAFLLIFFVTLVLGGLAADIGADVTKVALWVVSLINFVFFMIGAFYEND